MTHHNGHAQRFETNRGATRRFWEIERKKRTLWLSWGLVGGKTLHAKVVCPSVNQANKDYRRRIAQKTRKGYYRSFDHTRLPTLKRISPFQLTATVKLRCWGNKALQVQLSVEEGEKPETHQLSDLMALIDFTVDLRPRFEEIVFKYYASNVYGCFDDWDEEGNDISEQSAPPLNSPSDLWPLLGDPTFHLVGWIRKPASVTIELSFENCRWDFEHGFGAVFEDWQVTELGDARSTLPIESYDLMN